MEKEELKVTWNSTEKLIELPSTPSFAILIQEIKEKFRFMPEQEIGLKYQGKLGPVVVSVSITTGKLFLV
jgi:hypothetical protein